MTAVEAVSVALAGGQVWVVGPDLQTSLIIFEKCVQLSRIVEPYVTRRRVQPPGIWFRTGGSIFARSAENPNQLVGRGLDLIAIDECALIPDKSIWEEYLRPCLADRRGGAIFISTPKGRNWFWRLWNQGQHPDYPDTQSWRFPSSTNPYLSPEEIENARRALPDRVFRQEFEAEFLEDVGGVFNNVRSHVGATRQTARLRGHAYAIGVDLAKYEDFTVIAVVDITLRELCYIERHQKEDWNLQILRIIQASRYWGAPVCVDATGLGDPICDALSAAGVQVIPYRLTAATKNAAIQSLVMALDHNELRLLDEEWLLQELEEYEYQRTEQGNLRMSAPSGKHDDGVIALALAWHIAGTHSTPMRPLLVGDRPVGGARRRISRSPHLRRG